MTILVDAARWPWRGTYWCHLVSDDNLEELHDFARQLGCRRVGFQGDHYDIDRDTREQAITLGAVACDSRELVRRMKSAGLRLRPSQFTKWSLVDRGPDATVVADLLPDELRVWAPRADGCFRLSRSRQVGGEAAAVVVFGSSSEAPIAHDLASDGVFIRVDQRSGWSIEVITPPPLASE